MTDRIWPKPAPYDRLIREAWGAHLDFLEEGGFSVEAMRQVLGKGICAHGGDCDRMRRLAQWDNPALLLHTQQRYRGYVITERPKPIPDRSCDWEYAADGYDGAPDSGDGRCGTAASLEAAKAAIDLLHEETE